MMFIYIKVDKCKIVFADLCVYIFSDEDEHPVSGALFFAVCRGKVSEGLDFADNFARAVITVCK